MQQNNLILPPLDQREGVIWHDADFMPFAEAKVHILTQSLHYSTSVFEGGRIYNGKVFKLKEHIERLLESAKILKLKVRYSASDLIDATNELIKQNNLASGYLRPLIWRGSKSLKIGSLDNTTETMIAAWATGSDHFYSQKPINLQVSRWIKPPLNVMPAQCKSAGHYNMLIVSKYEAMEEGFGDALMLDEHGFIAECTTSNIFFVKDNKLYTPTTKYALNGITRQTIMQIAQDIGIDVIDGNFTFNDLQAFEESFISGTAAEIQKVASITYKDTKIEFAKYDLTEELSKRYSKLVMS